MQAEAVLQPASRYHAPAALPLGKTWYPLYRMLGGPQGWSGRVWEISPPLGFDPWTIQPIASRFIDCAIPAHAAFSITEGNGLINKEKCSSEDLMSWTCPGSTNTMT